MKLHILFLIYTPVKGFSLQQVNEHSSMYTAGIRIINCFIYADAAKSTYISWQPLAYVLCVCVRV